MSCGNVVLTTLEALQDRVGGVAEAEALECRLQTRLVVKRKGAYMAATTGAQSVFIAYSANKPDVVVFW